MPTSRSTGAPRVRARLCARAAALVLAACADAPTVVQTPSAAIGVDTAVAAGARFAVEPLDAVTRAALAAEPPTTIFVAPAGDDARDGRTAATAVRTIQRGVDLAGPGDVVGVAAGTYAEPDSNRDVVAVARGGTAARWLWLRAAPGQAVLIRARNWAAIRVSAPYVVVEGFHVVGPLRELLAGDPARALSSSQSDPVTNAGGIALAGPNGPPEGPLHHVVVRRNVVEQLPSGAISTYGADHVTVEDNVVRDCAYFAPWATSGISLYQNRASDRAGGYHMVVRRNRVRGCENRVPFWVAGRVTDGNGIIVDDGRNTQNGSTAGPYRWRTLVADNVVWDNGGRGVHIFASDHVDVVHNTSYRNSRSPEIPEGELSAIEAGDVRFVNNLAVATPGRRAATVYRGTQVWFVANLLTGGEAPARASRYLNLLGVDPRLTNPAVGVFTLRADSPARGAGTTWLATSTDVDGRPRTGRPDIGAYQSTAAPSAAATSSP